MDNHADLRERRWAFVRFALGMLQMGGAVISLVLLAFLGVSPIALGAVVLTSVCTAVSVILFGSRSPSNRIHHRKG